MEKYIMIILAILAIMEMQIVIAYTIARGNEKRINQIERDLTEKKEA